MGDDDDVTIAGLAVEFPQWVVLRIHARMYAARRLGPYRLSDTAYAAGLRYLVGAPTLWELRGQLAAQALIEEGIDAAERAAVAKLRADVDAYGVDGQDRRGVRDGRR